MTKREICSYLPNIIKQFIQRLCLQNEILDMINISNIHLILLLHKQLYNKLFNNTLYNTLNCIIKYEYTTLLKLYETKLIYMRKTENSNT